MPALPLRNKSLRRPLLRRTSLDGRPRGKKPLRRRSLRNKSLRRWLLRSRSATRRQRGGRRQEIGDRSVLPRLLRNKSRLPRMLREECRM
jgi:hypothetical protein